MCIYWFKGTVIAGVFLWNKKMADHIFVYSIYVIYTQLKENSIVNIPLVCYFGSISTKILAESALFV